MEQESNDAAVKDAQNLLRKEESAKGMVLKSNDTTVKDAQNKLKEEEFA